MNAHQFTIVLPDFHDLPDDLQDRVYEAGCDDALLGCVDGVVFLDFDREAESRSEAIQSAHAALTAAGLKNLLKEV